MTGGTKVRIDKWVWAGAPTTRCERTTGLGGAPQGPSMTSQASSVVRQQESATLTIAAR